MIKMVITTETYMYKLVSMLLMSNLPLGAIIEYTESKADFAFFEGSKDAAIAFGIIFNEQN